MRWIPLAAFCLCLIGLVLSLVALLTGVTANRPNAASIATFNISSLGLTDYHNLASPLFHNISALVPPGIASPPSITKYLGVKDWYTMHYFSTCSGFFAPSTSNPSLLSATKINVTCVRQGSGYIFSLGSILQRDINPSILALADEAASKVKNVDTRAWIILWYTGISTCFLTLCGLPFSFSGRRRHVNLRNFITSGVSFACLDISAALLTGHTVGIHRSGTPLGGPNPYPGTFLGIAWSTVVCMVLVFCLVQVEWKYEIWTPVGEPITIYRKPKDASWFAMRPKGSHKLKTYWDARHGI